MHRGRPRLPYGLPNDLTQRMLGPGRGTIAPIEYDQGLGALGWGFSFKKLGKSLKKAGTFVAKTTAKSTQLVTAPMRAAVLAPLKATTWAAKSAGIPVKRLDRFLKTEVNTAVKDTKTIAPVVVGAAAGFVTGGAGWLVAAKAGADLLGKSIPKGSAATAAPPNLRVTTPIPSVAAQANATIRPAVTDVPTTPVPPGQPDPAKVKALQAGFLPAGPAMPYVIGGMALVGLLGIFLAARSKPGQP